MPQTALSNRQRRLLKAGRQRVVGVAREPNGRISRAMKAKTAPVYSWLAPSLVKAMNKHPIDILADRGAISDDQRRAAFAWISDRAGSGLPYTAPTALNLTGVRAASENYGHAGCARRYNEATHVLKNRCGVYGHTLAYEACIQGQPNKVIADYFSRISRKPMADPTPRQHLAWQHLKMAFEELESYYGAQPQRKTVKGEVTA